ncbi:unnamed protein product, partial [Brenthis ino]
MSTIARSPPGHSLKHTASDSDISTITPCTPMSSNITLRSKRPRESSEEKFSTFKDEIKNMIESWKETQNSMLSKLVSEVSVIKQQNNDIKKSNEEIEKSLEFLNFHFEEMKKKIENLEAERKQHLLQISSLELKLDDIERNSKLSTIEMRNIPFIAQPESKATLSKIVQDTCKALDVNIQPNNIRDVYRLNGKSGKNTVIADLTTVIAKHDVINAAKKYNKDHPTQRLSTATIGFQGPIAPIYVSEALTSKGRRLFFLARDFAKSHHYKFCWTTHGKIFLRKAPDSPHIEVKNEELLATLRNQK